MSVIGNRIRECREDLGLTQEQLAQKLGYKSKTTINKIEKGINDITQSKVKAFADVLGTTPAYLMGWNDNKKSSTTTQTVDGKVSSSRRGAVINVLGRVAAGIPIEAIENIIDTEEITEEQARTGKFFGLCIQGDSMEPDIHNGDIVIVRQQEDAENDEIVIALVNGNDGVCKRLKKYENSIALVSNNPAYAPMYFSQEEIEATPVKIMGKVVELRRKF